VIVDVIRQVADWLEDDINAALALVPQDSGEAAPPSVAVKDETRAGWVARGTIPREKIGAVPLLLVRLDESAEVPLSTSQSFPRSEVPVEVLYVARKVATEVLVGEALQTLRAAARVLTQRFSPVLADGDLPRNATELSVPLNGRIGLVMESLAGDELVVARLTFAVPAVDPWGLAAINGV
jgi:hypothetical protein